MLIFAAFGMTALWQWYSGKKWMKFSLAVAALATGLLAVNGNVKAETANYITTSEANLASFYQEQKQYGKALELLSECLKENPGDLPVRFGLANVYRDLKKFPAAEEQYLAVLRMAPGHTGAMWELGLLYYMKGDIADARTQWERILSISPAHEKARQGLSLLDKSKARRGPAR
jgi:tetratricopeptide (TPR) repeat protein